MAVAYAFVKVLGGEGNPNIRNFPPEVDGPLERSQYLMQNGNMRGRYLGQWLDSCRWGSTETIMYEQNALEMTKFIGNWMRQNKGDLRFHERELPPNFELPCINYDACPRDPHHKVRNTGLDGSVRCIDVDEKKIRESLLESWITYDKLSQSRRKTVMEAPLEDWLVGEELEKLEKEPKIIVKERCGAIISEKDVTLPLAEIIDRLNIYDGSHRFCKGKYCREPVLKEFDLPRRSCFGHLVKDKLVFPFDGWRLARYVQKWYEQPPKGSAPLTTPQVTKRLMKSIKPF